MIKFSRFFIAACFACLLPLSVFAEAPVVDDSENFALLDDQQAAFERPAVREQAAVNNDEERAFVTDSSDARGSVSGNNATLLNKVQGLQQEIQELRGQLEVQAHDLKLLQQQQLSFYKDLDARLRHEPLKSAKNEPAAGIAIGQNEASANISAPAAQSKTTKPVLAGVNNPSRINPADEQISYLAAYELVKKKRFDDALIAMSDFISKYPQGGYSANAQYWLGELYLVKKDYQGAIEHFEAVLQQFPSSSKSAASMLKLGYAFAASGNKPEAVKRLEQVVQRYPDTNTAQLAKAKLATLS
jgi:tol-pal system protein YbgF